MAPHVRRLPPLDHRLDRNAAKAVGYEADAAALDAGLQGLEGLDDLFEGDGDHLALRELRSTMGLLRSRRNDKLDLAARHRAELGDG